MPGLRSNATYRLLSTTNMILYVWIMIAGVQFTRDQAEMVSARRERMPFPQFRVGWPQNLWPACTPKGQHEDPRPEGHAGGDRRSALAQFVRAPRALRA